MTWLLIGCVSHITDTANTSSDELSCGQQETQVVIGSGEFEWADLSPNDELTMVHGPQGGWHMLGSVRLIGTEQIVEIDYTIKDLESNQLVSDNHYRVALVMDGECTGYYPGMYGYLNVNDLAIEDLDTPPELLDMHQLELTMRTNDCPAPKDQQGLCVRADRWAESSMVVTAIRDLMDIE